MTPYDFLQVSANPTAFDLTGIGAMFQTAVVSEPTCSAGFVISKGVCEREPEKSGGKPGLTPEAIGSITGGIAGILAIGFFVVLVVRTFGKGRRGDYHKREGTSQEHEYNDLSLQSQNDGKPMRADGLPTIVQSGMHGGESYSDMYDYIAEGPEDISCHLTPFDTVSSDSVPSSAFDAATAVMGDFTIVTNSGRDAPNDDIFVSDTSKHVLPIVEKETKEMLSSTVVTDLNDVPPPKAHKLRSELGYLSPASEDVLKLVTDVKKQRSVFPRDKTSKNNLTSHQGDVTGAYETPRAHTMQTQLDYLTPVNDENCPQAILRRASTSSDRSMTGSTEVFLASAGTNNSKDKTNTSSNTLKHQKPSYVNFIDPHSEAASMSEETNASSSMLQNQNPGNVNRMDLHPASMSEEYRIATAKENYADLTPQKTLPRSRRAAHLHSNKPADRPVRESEELIYPRQFSPQVRGGFRSDLYVQLDEEGAAKLRLKNPLYTDGEGDASLL